ncbi:MAG: sigma-70 family RNA polymerase sigma factor [Pseudomonadales bacterium]|nr:sigma-70 family RNA polymerase sigma factor [Pseudomonadales bacterium]
MTATGVEEELIAAALQGSAAAWEQLVRRHESRVYNFALRLTGNPADARDLMQEVFLGMFRNLHNFRGDAQFSSWLFRIAHNKSVDMKRRQRPSLMQSLQAGHGDVGGFDSSFEGALDAGLGGREAAQAQQPEQSAISEQDNARINRMLAALPLEQRMLVELKVYQAMTFEDIAAVLDIPANTAKTRFYNALGKLKIRMEQDDEM